MGQLLTERAARFGTCHECDIGIDTLTLNVMGIADNGSLRNSIMEHQRTFYFRRSQSVAGYVNDIVHPACYPIVSVSISSGAVSCQIKARIGREIGIDAAFMVAKYGANLARPALRNHQIALSRAIKLVSVGIQQSELNPKKRFCCGAGLEVCYSR